MGLVLHDSASAGWTKVCLDSNLQEILWHMGFVGWLLAGRLLVEDWPEPGKTCRRRRMPRVLFESHDVELAGQEIEGLGDDLELPRSLEIHAGKESQFGHVVASKEIQRVEQN